MVRLIIFEDQPELIEPARIIYEQELLNESLLSYVSMTPGTKELGAKFVIPDITHLEEVLNQP